MRFNVGPLAQLAVCTILPGLGTVLVAARFALRIARKLGLSIDDWLCLSALIFTWGCAGVVIWGVSVKQLGQHSPKQSFSEFMDTTVKEQMTVHKIAWLFTFFSYLALGFAKLSVLFFYRRIFCGRMFNMVTWTFIIIVLLWMCVFSILWFFSCGIHFQDMWGTIQSLETHCLDLYDQLTIGSAVDFGMDVLIFSLPAAMIWPLQMSIKRKVVAVGILLTGAISVGFGVLRFIATKVLTDFQTHIEKGGSALGIPVTDSVGVISVIVILTMAEVGVALVAICLPTLRPGSLFHGGRWRWVSPVGSGAESRSGSSKEQCVPQSSNDRRQSCEESEADLDDDENQIDPRIGSRAQAEKSTKFRTGYEELILTSSGKVEVRPKEAV